MSFVAPIAAGPVAGASLKFSDQPITLVLTNGVATSGTLTYSVDVATDNAFANKVVSKTGIVPSAGPTTSVILPTLNGNQTYYWRAFSVVGTTSTAAQAPKSFYVGPNVTLSPPVIESPSSSVVNSVTPTFTVADVARTGTPGGTIFYDFQVASDSGFTNIIADSGQVSEQPTQTSWTSTVSLGASNYSLRVEALDPTDSVTTPFTTTSFQVQPFDPTQAIMMSNPGNFMVAWPQTANITSVDFESDYFYVTHDKMDGPDRWPDVPFGTGSLQYTLGLCLNVYGQGQWYCSAAIQYWFGRPNGASTNVASDWYYDPARWGPMAGYQPQNGEIVGIFVGAGNLRDVTDGSGSYVLERSNVLLMPFGGQFSLSSAARRLLNKGIKLFTPPGVPSAGVRPGGGRSGGGR